jgi:hypothetical protein
VACFPGPVSVPSEWQYHAPCHSSSSLTFSLMPISLSTHNILQDELHRATYTVSMPYDNARSAMSRARVSLIGVSTGHSHLARGRVVS